MADPKDKGLTDADIAKRRDQILRNMLDAPPETHDEMVKRRQKKRTAKKKPAKN